MSAIMRAGATGEKLLKKGGAFMRAGAEPKFKKERAEKVEEIKIDKRIEGKLNAKGLTLEMLPNTKEELLKIKGVGEGTAEAILKLKQPNN